MPLKCVHAIVSGRVQGVGFRYFVGTVADRLGVTGWVRNVANGDVEVWAQAEPEVLEDFIGRLRTGPPTAYVQNVAVEWKAPDPNLSGFDFRPTAYR